MCSISTCGGRLHVTLEIMLPGITPPGLPPRSDAYQKNPIGEDPTLSVLLEYLGGMEFQPTAAVQVTLRVAPSMDCNKAFKIMKVFDPVGVIPDGIGQITKLLTVVDSLRKPVALGRTPVLVVGMLSWQAPPPTADQAARVAALAVG